MSFFNHIWQHIFFSHVTPLVKIGATRRLESEDIPPLPVQANPRQIPWDENAIDWSTGPQILNTLFKVGRKSWLNSLGLYLGASLITLSGPVLVNNFIKNLSGDLESSFWITILIGTCIGASGIVAGLLLQHYFYLHLIRQQIVVNILNAKIFRQALHLSNPARERIPIGDIVNHLSSDTDSVSEVFAALSDLIYCIFMIGGAIGLLFYYLGSTAWVAVILLGTLLPITKKVGREFTRFDEELMHQRDRRISLMSQVLNAIRLVKYFTWEASVTEEISVIRKTELAARKRIARAELMVTLLYVSVGTLVLFAVFAIHSWRGGEFNAALVFTCVSLFALLEDPFAFISRTISIFISAKVGADRIAKFLAQPKSPALRCSTKASGATALGLRFKHVSVELGETKHPALTDFNLNLNAGRSVAVIGAVGSGKSTLIQSIIGEIELTQGTLQFIDLNNQPVEVSRLGYVPQEAYILNSSLRENLTFGRRGVPIEEIEHALNLAGLLEDIRRLEGGLDTEIGERGVNLSGGQKQRLSLARAILHRPQVVVLDDPLSAVDATTEKHLIHHLIFGEWAKTTRVVITHRLTHLAMFDSIAYLEKGRLIDHGTYAELQERCQAFRLFQADYGHSNSHSPSTSKPLEAVPVPKVEQKRTRITDDEDRESGSVKKSVYIEYLLSLGGENKQLRPYILLLLAVAAASGTLLPLLQKGWLAVMSNAQTSGATLGWLERLASNPISAIYIYGGIGLMILGGTLLADLFWLNRGLVAGRNVHDRMLQSVLGSRIRFFDATPVGRILQRFSRDMEAIDIHLQWSFEHSMKCFAQVLITLSLIFFVLPWVAVFILPVLVVYYHIQKLYRSSVREVKRLDSISRSPRYAHFKETLQGLTVIRAYGRTDWFLDEFYGRLNHWQRMFHGHVLLNRWFSSRIPAIGGLVSLFTTVGIVLSVQSGTLSPGMAGMLTVYSLSFWGVLNWGVRIWAEVESRMTSMERVKTYSVLSQEPAQLNNDLINWPTKGEVVFENAFARYDHQLPMILKGLSFTIPAGTKAGIIGRTGSGKSTLFQAIYRFIDLESGRILIDGVDISTMPLNQLRRSLAIIPQDPTLFMGTVRMNLDRFNEFTDEEIWSALDRTCLSEVVQLMPKGLQSELTENGANLSQGQRQLMCLARALLLKAKVIIMDEATASVDVRTDLLVQRVVREASLNITMLIIAHRLGTVQDCDQILEIENGRLLSSEPAKLSKLEL